MKTTRAAAVAASIVLLTGCEAGAPSAGGRPSAAGPAPVAPSVAAAKLSPACDLPVSFDLLPRWNPAAVDLDELGEVGGLYRNGPFATVCEVDAKPAGEAGVLEVRKATYAQVTLGGQPAAEVTYETYNKSMDHLSRYSAFAVNTPAGAVVVKLSPFGADGYDAMRPAFDLAKRTLTVTR